MTWSYDNEAPGSSGKSFVRLLIGDTSSGSAQLEDEEIEAILAVDPNRYSAAATACEILATSFAQRADQKVGELQVRLSQIADNYLKSAARLRAKAKVSGGGAGGGSAQVYAGGISHSDVESVEQDTDQVRGKFKVGMTDFPGFADLSETSTED